MRQTSTSSKQNFDRYRVEIFADHDSPTGKKRRDRSSGQLVKSFLRLLADQKWAVIFSLATLTVSTILSLIPPATTKIVVEYVLGDTPLPDRYPDWLPRDRWSLLWSIVGLVVAISFVRLGLHVWGRWHATRVTKLLQL